MEKFTTQGYDEYYRSYFKRQHNDTITAIIFLFMLGITVFWNGIVEYKLISTDIY